VKRNLFFCLFLILSLTNPLVSKSDSKGEISLGYFMDGVWKWYFPVDKDVLRGDVSLATLGLKYNFFPNLWGKILFNFRSQFSLKKDIKYQNNKINLWKISTGLKLVKYLSFSLSYIKHKEKWFLYNEYQLGSDFYEDEWTNTIDYQTINWGLVSNFYVIPKITFIGEIFLSIKTDINTNYYDKTDIHSDSGMQTIIDADNFLREGDLLYYLLGLEFDIWENLSLKLLYNVWKYDVEPKGNYPKYEFTLQGPEIRIVYKFSPYLSRVKKRKLMQRYFMRGTQYYLKGEYEKAIREWEKVLKLDPNHKPSKAKIKKAENKLLKGWEE